jgi:molybdopterin synthase catalytic subunit
MDGEVSVRLVREPLDVHAALIAVSGTGVGGIDLFLGITRADRGPTFGELLALEYYAYEEMALMEMGRLVKNAGERWPILRVTLWHRLGSVAVGEASVVVAVGCAHRSDAFDACRFLIDELKKSVPIWKKEIHASIARWQGHD